MSPVKRHLGETTSLLLVLSFIMWNCPCAPAASVATTAAAQSCPAVCQCSDDLTKVTCTDYKLNKVPDGLPTAVQRLNLNGNHITGIQAADFSGLVDLRWLSIKQNFIITIEDGAFQDQANLKDLFLTHNKLEIVNLAKDTFRGLRSLQHLYLEQNNLVAIPDASHMPSLLSLSLDYNVIVSAAFPGYSGVTRLQSITLSNNKIESLSPQDFAELNPEFVTKVTLSRNNIKRVSPGVFTEFRRLKSLDISYNVNISKDNLINIINSLEYTSLDKLDLDGVVNYQLPADVFSRLHGIPQKVLSMAHSDKWVVQNGTFESLSALGFLDLSYNKMVVFQNGAFRGLDSLTRLQLNNNRIGEVPEDLPPSLTYLDLSQNYNLDTLPRDRFINMANLANLTMANGNIQTVYGDALVGLSMLIFLDLSNNKLSSTSIPKQLFDPVNSLHTLNLAKNRLSDIKNESKLFALLASLVELNMSENGCHTLPTDIFHSLTSLRILDLHGNKLGHLLATDTEGELFKALTELRELNLNDSRITYLPKLAFSRLSSLDKLHLGGNSLMSWDPFLFGGLSNIQFVDLTENSISLVNQTSLSGLRYGAQLDLSGNPFACWCELIWFREWMNDPNSTLLNEDRYMCNSPAEYADTPLLAFRPADIHNDCHKPPWTMIISASVAGAVALVFVTITLSYRYRWPLRRSWYLFKRRRQRLAFRKQGHGAYEELDGTDTLYDFSILYHGSAVDWVKHTLVERIAIDETVEPQEAAGSQADSSDMDVPNDEDPTPLAPPHKWRVFFEDGALSGNQIAIDCIAQAIFKSRRSILVVSERCLHSSKFRDYELPFAIENTHERGLGPEGLILIMLEDVVDQLPRTLWSIRERRVTWVDDDVAGAEQGQKYFWDRLQDELEHYPEPMDV